MPSVKKMRVVLLASEWGSKRGGLSTFNRELAIQLAKQPEVQVSVLVPGFDQDENNAALNRNVTLVKATPLAGFDEIDWLSSPPDDLQIDFVIGHGVVLGRHAQVIRKNRHCKWIQFVHTDPEELGMFKDYPDAISKGATKHGNEVALCVIADCVVAVGPKLAEAYRSYLRFCRKDQDVFVLTPGIFSEFSDVVQSNQDGGKCRVLAFGRGDLEDFSLKGFDVAAKAVSKLDGAHLIFVGAQDKRQAEVADRFKEGSIPSNRLRIRTFIEIREQLKHQFSEVDIAIMPSRTEGFGLVALEAMSAGLPVLVSANSGFGEALKKVKFGPQCVVPSEDATVWAEKIKEIWGRDREIRLEEAQDVCQNYGKKYSWEQQCKELVEKMANILNADASSSKLERKPPSSEDAGSSMTEHHEDHRESAGAPSLKKPRTTESTTEETKESNEVSPSLDALEWLSLRVGKSWEALARRLGFIVAEITGFHKSNEEYAEKARSMLFRWKEKNGSGATYEVLCNALRNEFVGREDLAEKLQQLKL